MKDYANNDNNIAIILINHGCQLLTLKKHAVYKYIRTESAIYKENISICFDSIYTGINLVYIIICIYNIYAQGSICSELK